jgi:chromosome partitioning protein
VGYRHICNTAFTVLRYQITGWLNLSLTLITITVLLGVLQWSNHMKRILLASPKGGVGKSTLTRNLAVAAVHDFKKVATADLDPQATLTIWSRRRPDTEKPIPHYKVNWEDADALLDDAEMPGIEVLLIDTPPSIETQPAAFNSLVKAAAFVLVPCRPTFDDAESAAPFLKHLHQQGKKAAVILTFVKPRVNISAVKGYLLEHGDICPVEIADRTDYARAGAKGLGLIDIPNHVGGDEVRGVWVYVKNQLWRKARVSVKAR